MMEKDKNILSLLAKLKLICNFSDIQILDYWDADQCAIGLKKGSNLIYISTYGYNVNEIKYDYDLEYWDEDKVDNIKVIKEARSVTQDELLLEIIGYFGLNSD